MATSVTGDWYAGGGIDAWDFEFNGSGTLDGTAIAPVPYPSGCQAPVGAKTWQGFSLQPDGEYYGTVEGSNDCSSFGNNYGAALRLFVSPSGVQTLEIAENQSGAATTQAVINADGSVSDPSPFYCFSLGRATTGPSYRPANGCGAASASAGPRFAEAGGAGSLSENRTTCQAGRPVNCATGTFWHTFTDARVPGNGAMLDLTRTYSSDRALTDSRFGFGWSDRYSMALAINGSTGNATVTEEDGAEVPFIANGSGGFAAPARVLASLTNNGDGTYTFTRFSDHVRRVFNSSWQLIKEIDRNGYATTLSYSGGELSSVTDPSGRTLTITYAGSHVSSVQDPLGHTWTYAYDGSGNLTSVTDPLARTWSFTYDANHLVVTMTDPRGGETANTYDSSSRVTTQVDPAGRATTWSYSGVPASSSGSTTTITDPLGNVVVEQYANFELRSVTRRSGTPEAATTTYQYDPNTLGISQTTDANGKVSTYAYDSRGNLLTSTDPLGHTTSYSYNGFDEVTSKTDPLGTATTYSYDGNGNLLSKSTPLSGGGTARWSYTYGSGSKAGDVMSSTNPDGNTTTYDYDSAGDPTSIADPLGNKTTKTYDSDGRLLSTKTANGNTTSYITPASK